MQRWLSSKATATSPEEPVESVIFVGRRYRDPGRLLSEFENVG
jgi:hypothetical protein